MIEEKVLEKEKTLNIFPTNKEVELYIYIIY